MTHQMSGIHDSHERNISEIQTLCHHLRTHEDLNFFFLEIAADGQNLFDSRLVIAAEAERLIAASGVRQGRD